MSRAFGIELTDGMKHMVVSAVSFSLMGLFVRMLRELPSIEIVMFRAGISLVISAGLLIHARKSLIGKHRGLLFLRGLFGFIALSAYFYSIHELPLAEAVPVQYTSPLFTAMLAPLILKEKNKGNEWLAMLTAFAGVLIIARPGSFSSAVPVLIGLSGAFCSGVAYNIVRKLGMKGEDPLTIVMYFPLVALLLGTPFAIDHWRMPVGWEWGALLMVGITTQTGQVALTKGLRLERAARASIVNYLVIFLSTIYSLVLGEELGLASFVGMALILLGITLVGRQRS
ncbi:MAG: DMT family transporter [Bacteroidia bacterium]|nr:DMT family transporter [Bacteroidia bacterium]